VCASNRMVKSIPVLRVALQPSRIGSVVLGTVTIGTALLLAFLPADIWLRAAAILITGAGGIHALRYAVSISTRRAIVALELGADRRAITTDRSGRRGEAMVQPESHVGAMLTTLVLRPDGARRSRSLLVLPDTMPADEFRRLRVLLRHGQPARGPSP